MRLVGPLPWERGAYAIRLPGTSLRAPFFSTGLTLPAPGGSDVPSCPNQVPLLCVRSMVISRNPRARCDVAATVIPIAQMRKLRSGRGRLNHPAPGQQIHVSVVKPCVLFVYLINILSAHSRLPFEDSELYTRH